jgi:hypothetical protein
MIRDRFITLKIEVTKQGNVFFFNSQNTHGRDKTNQNPYVIQYKT